MSEQTESFRVTLNCVTGEKIVFRRELREGALVEVELEKKIVQVHPEALWLTINGLHLDRQPTVGGK